MPGKVNPSIPEMVNQVCFQVIGCDTTVCVAAEAGQLELNVMMPVIAWNALHSSTILRNAMHALATRCVEGIEADADRCRELLDRSTAMATALSPYIGYARTAEIAKESVRTGRPIREIVLERGLLDAATADRVLSAEAMTQPGDRRRRQPEPALKDHEAPASPGPRRSAPASRFDGAGAPHSQTEPRHRELFPPEDLGLLEGPDRAVWQKPDQIMDALGIADGAKVADIGAGAGWFTIRLARRVGPNGVVYAQDVQQQMLDVIRRRVDARGSAQRPAPCSGEEQLANLPPARSTRCWWWTRITRSTRRPRDVPAEPGRRRSSPTAGSAS